jgi:hypothetical protein
VPVTINKLRAMNATSSFSSQTTGHEAAYAIDNSSGTWWEPAATDAAPMLTLELSPATKFDPVQTFTIDSCRMMFNAGGGIGGRGGARGGRGAAPEMAAAGAAEPAVPLPVVNSYQYKIEASTDGTTYATVLDQTKNGVSRNTLFEEIPPTTCRFVRLTMTNWPRGTPLGILEFTVFGKSVDIKK